MVALRRSSDLRELAVAPVVIAAVDDDAAHGRAVAVDPLRRRIDHDIGSPFERIAQIARRAEGVVDNQRHVATSRQRAQRLQIGHVARGVAHALGIEHLGAVVDQGLEILGRLARRYAAVDAQLAQRYAELVVCAAIKERRSHYVVALGGESRNGNQYGRHSRRHAQRAHGVVKSRHALLVGRGGGILQTGIDVAAFAQLEESGRVVAALEAVGCGGVDGYAARSRAVGMVTAVDLLGLKTQFVLRHDGMVLKLFL